VSSRVGSKEFGGAFVVLVSRGLGPAPVVTAIESAVAQDLDRREFAKVRWAMGRIVFKR
jgi:hypothetical protein